MTNQLKSIIRPPIVTVLGHVDHGKTTLLDYIRKTNITTKEYGGITQHIGAYQIDVPPKIRKKDPNFAAKITFIDTPGHEAFAKMRSHGAGVADIAILLVAANDGVKPQTIESIDHIRNAKIPSIVVANKMDLSNINLEKVKKQLTRAGIALEEYGGEVPLIPISAKTGSGIEKLLETIIFLTDFFQIKSKINEQTTGVVIESTISKFKGITGTLLLREGKLRVADEVINENQEFKIRAICDWQGKQLTEIKAGDPAEIIGWKTIPRVGSFLLKKTETRLEIRPHQDLDKFIQKPVTIDKKTGEIEDQRIKLIIKADTQGTLDAIIDGLSGTEVEVIHKGIGAITESDILLAKTAKALVVGFNQKVSDQVLKLAQSEKVLIKTYNIIYELFDEVADVIEAIKKGDLVTILGEAKVLALFNFKGDTIIGAKVVKGRIARGDQVKIMRNETELIRTKIKSLKHLKEDITKAETGQEVGIGLAQKAEILTGDSIISIG